MRQYFENLTLNASIVIAHLAAATQTCDETIRVYIYDSQQPSDVEYVIGGSPAFAYDYENHRPGKENHKLIEINNHSFDACEKGAFRIAEKLRKYAVASLMTHTFDKLDLVSQ